ncbi:MAG: hypothetical protein RLZZ350_1982, partial [Verrucomicrobiota bacterium]
MKKSTIAVTLLGLALAANCHAGQATKWADLPDAVRATVLANGGKEGQSVDNEGEKTGGQDTYEASVKDKDGNTADLVITADGKLVETK